MSADLCPTWQGFIAGLEQAAGLQAGEPPADPDELTRRGDRAVRKLRRTYSQGLAEIVHGALYPQDKQAPQPPDGIGPYGHNGALARLWWPLVLTTNYDDLYLNAFRQAWGSPPLVRGRSPADCRSVLASLGSPMPPILWTLQGFLGGVTPLTDLGVDEARREDLTAELVIGHQEYRRVTHTSAHFRKAFAEVFRSRSLLFLGCSLKDRYLLELFGEILEMYGPSPQPHVAFVKAQEFPPDVREFLRTEVGIRTVVFQDFEDLTHWLGRMADALDPERPQHARWEHHLPDEGGSGMRRVVLTSDPAPEGTLRLPDLDGEATLETWRRIATEAMATRRTLAIEMPAKTGAWAPHHALMVTLRAWAKARRHRAEQAPDLTVHLPEWRTRLEISMGRLDPVELLLCPDVRFRFEVLPRGGDAEQEVLCVPESTPLRTLCQSHGIDGGEWTVQVEPAAQVRARPLAQVQDRTLDELGLLPGGRVQLRQKR